MDISGLFLHVDSAYTFYGVFSKLLVSSVIARELDKQKAIFFVKNNNTSATVSIIIYLLWKSYTKCIV